MQPRPGDAVEVSAEGVDELAFPDDLDAWRRWEQGQRRLYRIAARAKARLYERAGTRMSAARKRPAPQLLLPEGEPDVLVVVDGWSPSCRAAVGDVVRHLDPRRTAVLAAAPEALEALAPGRHAVSFESVDRIPSSVREVVTLGAFSELAGRVEPWAQRHDVRFSVVQHGALTPWAPPLTDGTHLFAWSEADAEYWRAGRNSITTEVTGSQLLWNARRQPPVTVADERPVMLGQLHGTELPAWSMQRLYTRFCVGTGADYRPHPNEADAMSRAQHRLMRAAGVRFERSGMSVLELGRPVVSVFSTGTLEAAQRGLPAYVHHPDPPPWVRAFWTRYGLASFGGAPTAPALLPPTEPARAIAAAVQP